MGKFVSDLGTALSEGRLYKADGTKYTGAQFFSAFSKGTTEKTFKTLEDARSYHVSKPASSSSSASSTNQDSRLFSNNARRQNLFGN